MSSREHNPLTADGPVRECVPVVPVRDTIARAAGRVIGTLHNQEFVHGDLTTSNMIVRDVTNALVRGLCLCVAPRTARSCRAWPLSGAFGDKRTMSTACVMTA